jgi:hypothetical protein
MQVFCESIRETLGTDFYLVIKQIVAVVTFSMVPIIFSKLENAVIIGVSDS